MSDALIDAYSALDARMKVVDVIANNLANANTTGYKRDFAHIFQDETRFDTGTQVDVSPGDIVSTGNELDAAINGPGFFVIQTPDGIRYTRNGSFSMNADGELVTKDGMPVLNTVRLDDQSRPRKNRNSGWRPRYCRRQRSRDIEDRQRQ